MDGKHASFPLRLAASTKKQIAELARREGISLNQFLCIAVAEKVARLEYLRTKETQALAEHKKAS
jgi:predicted HicB family RNase H-like nuclease